jgi:hypothetical protein
MSVLIKLNLCSLQGIYGSDTIVMGVFRKIISDYNQGNDENGRQDMMQLRRYVYGCYTYC